MSSSDPWEKLEEKMDFVSCKSLGISVVYLQYLVLHFVNVVATVQLTTLDVIYVVSSLML